MTESKPMWTVGKLVSNKGQRAVLSETERVCLVDTQIVGDRDQTARLIAAAPALYDALSDLLFLCDNSDFSNGVVDQTGQLDEGQLRAGDLIAKARAALAQARGE